MSVTTRVTGAIRWASLALLLACATDRPAPPTAPAGDRARLDEFPWTDPVWLGPVVNSAARDLPGALTRDGLTLYLQSARTGSLGGDDIWISRRDCLTCEWQAPENLGAVINTAGFDGGPHLSRDGCLLFFSSVGHGAHASDIFVSWRPDPGDDSGWQSPVSLGPAVNSDGSESGPALLQLGDGNSELYFVTDRRGLGNEIWMARVTRSGVPLGDAVRVEELNDPLAQDQGMTIRRDGRELIFWSGSQPVARPGGVGLSDIWVTTRRNGNEPWSAPQNIGMPVNSPLGDLAPVLSRDGRTLFFSSNTGRNGLGLGLTDIWMSTRAQDIGEEQHDDVSPAEDTHRQCAPRT